ncbi:MAG TPA: multiheme c-type cytochrome [Sedimentisphaerales bacterium]|jgi:hypothetical protein|nr:multiheme c-type cytochrome [Sedimentisphaerales bacterium]HNU31257.1 multiheme c-type cytochrome [Sedimentisphaerales bacterium]
MERREGCLPVPAILLGSLLLLAAMSCSFDDGNRSAASQTAQAAKAPAEPQDENDYYAKPTQAFVANPYCRACHLDFDEEELALDHELAGIGCERCHGESLRHRSDEGNVTPPELMYPKERINPTCMMCHPRHEINHLQDHQPILEAGLSIFQETPSSADAKKYCTDCHGIKHRMQNRTTRWNKATGEVIR